MDEKVDNSKKALATQETQFSTLAKALTVVGSTSGFIFGPLLLIGGTGWFIADTANNQIYLFISLIIALATSNVLIFKYTNNILKKVSRNE